MKIIKNGDLLEGRITGQLAQMALKTKGFTYQQLTAGQRNDVNNFFFGN